MKLKYSFETVDLGNEIVAVPVGEGADQISGVVKLNDSALEIFNMLKDNTTAEDITKVLVGKYEDHPQTIRMYVDKTINVLIKASLVEE